jgi:arylsulfate sulfotransferase
MKLYRTLVRSVTLIRSVIIYFFFISFYLMTCSEGAAENPDIDSARPSDTDSISVDSDSNGDTNNDADTNSDADSAGPGSTASFEPHAYYDILVNPYGNSPLVAVVNLHGIDSSQVESIQVVVAGQDGGQDFERTYSPTDTAFAVQMDSSDLTFPEDGYHVPVLGLYPDCENDVYIAVDLLDRDSVNLTLQIETHLPDPNDAQWPPGISVDKAVVEQMEPGWSVAEISIEPNPNPPIVFAEWTRLIAFDERGAIRWDLQLDLPKGETFTTRRSQDGNFLTGSFDTIVEVTKLGRIARTVQLPDHTIHHEIVQIGYDDNGKTTSTGVDTEYSGNLLVLASRNDASTIQDRIVELNLSTGEVLNEWDIAAVLDPDRKAFLPPEEWPAGSADWFHANGIAYSVADESIIVSGRHQGVAKIRRDGSLVWLLAPHNGWNEPQSLKLLTAVNESGAPYGQSVQLGDEAAGDSSDPEFDWPFGQHSPSLLPNGDLLVFDNGCRRHFGSPYDSYSRAVVYRIDEAAMTVRQIAQFALSRYESSFYVSNNHQLPATGNILIQAGGSARNPAVFKETAIQIADDGTITFDTVVFEATLDLNIIDTSSWYIYSFRGHRWMF